MRLAIVTLLLLFFVGCSAPEHAGVWPDETWPTATPESQGIDPAAIDTLVAEIEAGTYGLVDAFMLIRNGYVVADHRFEQDYESIASEYDTTSHQYNYNHPNWHPYYQGSELHTLQSVTKSVTSAALGIAIDQGFVEGPDALVMPYFASYAPYPTSSRRDSTTLDDFLTMRSGIEWNTSGPYGTGEHSTDLLESSDEWIRFVLDQPTDTIPGTQFEYNDGVSVLIGKIVTEATGTRLDQWANEQLFQPIGIDDFHWKITPDGEVDSEGGLYLATEDLARIGYLFLRDGQWKGEQIVSAAWVETSTAPVIPDLVPDDPDVNIGYGYQWWIPRSEEGETKIFSANGYGGQFLHVVPDQDIVAVFNGWHIHGSAEKSTWTALQNQILPYVTDEASGE